MKGVSSGKLADLIATYQIQVPFSFIHFRDIVDQYAQHVPQIHQERAEVSVVTGPCFRCKKQGHSANDCVQLPTFYRCNKVGHISTKCRVCEVYCSICKNARHVTKACRETRTMEVTAGSAPKITDDREENKVPSGAEELWTVSQWMTGSAFVKATVSTAVSGSNNLVHKLKFWWIRVICCLLGCVLVSHLF